MASSLAVGGTSATVEAYAGFADNDYLLFGNPGDEKTEILQVNDAAIDLTVTIGAAVYLHPAGTPVYLIAYNQIEFSIATTETGTKTTLQAATALVVDGMEHIYDDTTNTTGFGFYRYKNAETATFSGYSDPIPYAGYDLDAAQTIFDRALSVTSTEVSPRMRYEILFSFLNDFVAYANSVNIAWSEAKVIDTEMATLTEGDFEIALPTNIARRNDPSAIISLHINGYERLTYVPQREWNRATINLVYTTLAEALATTDTDVTLTNSAAFFDSGSVLINDDVISYTTNTRSTDTISGLTGIDAVAASGDYVFQNYLLGVPRIYTVTSAGNIRLWPLVDAATENRILFVDYYRKIPTVNSVGDKILLQQIQPAIDYVAYRIRKHMAGGTLSMQDEDFQQFSASLLKIIEQNTSGEPGKIIVR